MSDEKHISSREDLIKTRGKWSISNGSLTIYESDRDDSVPLVKSRRCVCTSCARDTWSNTQLPFFKERPEKVVDDYYCGCYGFD